MKAWLEVRGIEPGPLFYNLDRGHRRQRLTKRGIRDLVYRLGKRAGVKSRPHGLRHAAISAALEASGGNVHAAQQFGRHADPKTTMVYYDRVRDLHGETADLVVSAAALEMPS